MFDFIRKARLWELINDGVADEIGTMARYELKTAQDIAVYSELRGRSGQRLAEVGGGASRLLERLARDNECWNIDRFEGAGQGPTTPVDVTNVKIIDAYLGDFDSNVQSDFFDCIFSISVVEHVTDDRLDAFQEDVIRSLRPGGTFIHAIDVYIPAVPTPSMHHRFEGYRRWVTETPNVEPIGDVLSGPLQFSCDMASNPDNVLFDWGRLVPALRPLREASQSVSLIVSGRRLG